MMRWYMCHYCEGKYLLVMFFLPIGYDDCMTYLVRVSDFFWNMKGMTADETASIDSIQHSR